jgi:hypothetical protein
MIFIFWCALSRILCTALPWFRTFWHSEEAHASSNEHRHMHTNTYINFLSHILSNSYSVYVYIFINLFGCLGTTYPSFCPNFSDPTDLSESWSVSSRSNHQTTLDHPYCVLTHPSESVFGSFLRPWFNRKGRTNVAIKPYKGFPI